MAPMPDVELENLARKHLSLPQGEKPPCAYLKKLIAFLALYPQFADFKVRLEPGKGFGKLLCNRKDCGIEVALKRDIKSLPHGGKDIGFGTFGAYATHIASHHQQACDEALRSGTLPLQSLTSSTSSATTKRRAEEPHRRPEKKLKARKSSAISIFTPVEDPRIERARALKQADDARGRIAQLERDLEEARTSTRILPAARKELIPELESEILMWKERLVSQGTIAFGPQARSRSVALGHRDQVSGKASVVRRQQPSPSSSASQNSITSHTRRRLLENANSSDVEAQQRAVQATSQLIESALAKAEDSLSERPFNGPDFDDLLGSVHDNTQDDKSKLASALLRLGLKTESDALVGTKIVLLDYQIVGVDWMIQQEQKPVKGGILADDMGLGKTVQAIALVCLTRGDAGDSTGPTLIVVPAALSQQWFDELKKHAPHFRVLVYHRDEKPQGRNAVKTLRDYHVVIASYEAVAGEAPIPKSPKKVDKKKEQGAFLLSTSTGGSAPGPLHKVPWERVIADEGHYIRNEGTRRSIALWNLDARYRWCLTGTPLINGLKDAYGLIRFLRVKPWDDRSEFYRNIVDPGKNQPRVAGLRLQSIFNRFLLRRRKDSLFDGRPLVELPPKTIELHIVDFQDHEERLMYDMRLEQCQAVITKYLSEGTLLKNTQHAFALMTSLRQCDIHPSLIVEDLTEMLSALMTGLDADSEVQRAENLMGLQWVKDLQAKSLGSNANLMNHDILNTPVSTLIGACDNCQETRPDLSIAQCKHVLCGECIQDLFDCTEAKQDVCCPMCAIKITRDRLFHRAAFLPTDAQLGIQIDATWTSPGYARATKVPSSATRPDKGLPFSRILSVDGRVVSSTKFNLTRDIILNTPTDDKVVVFCDFVRALNLLGQFLSEAGITNVQYNGTMSRKARANAVAAIMEDPKIKVILVSTKAGGVGLNFTNVNHVIMLNPAWSEAVEAQAIDRTHRIGQKKPVFVYRLGIEDTIECRIFELQERKKDIVDVSLGEAGFSLRHSTLSDILRMFNMNGRAQLGRGTTVTTRR